MENEHVQLSISDEWRTEELQKCIWIASQLINVLFAQVLYQKHIPGIPDHYKGLLLSMMK